MRHRQDKVRAIPHQTRRRTLHTLATLAAAIGPAPLAPLPALAQGDAASFPTGP